MIRRTLLAAIAATTLILIGFHVASGNYSIAAMSGLLGSAWLFLEIERRRSFSSFFMAALIGSALLASLNHAPSPLILLGVVTDLAAWDLSRFLARIRPFTDKDVSSDLHKKHLRQLATPLCAGYGLALLPMFIRLPVGFVVFLILILLGVIMFRKSILTLREK